MMDGFGSPDWMHMFLPDGPLIESFARGSAIYLSLLFLFRIVLKRQTGSIGLPDVMLVVLVSECVSSSLSAETKSIPNGLATVIALLFWNYAIDWLCYRSAWLRRLLEPQPLRIIEDGRLLRENMAKERVTTDELESKLREQGIDEVARVKAAFIEPDGGISVVPKDAS